MPNPEHVAILGQGVEVWNQWRKEHPVLQPDLSFADLHEYPLAGINFGHVYLHGAHLIRIDLDNSQLEGAYLHDSDLFHASLINANLAKAHFSRTNLNKARMIRANLSGADIHEVNFVGADLREANMTGAFLSQSVFDGVDLRQVKGLDMVGHLSPSAISLRTIILSGGKIPEVFLRGVGIPEAIIEQIPALIGSLSPIDYYSCFISYSSKDQDFADRLYADLQSKGVRCWFAPHDMKIGDEIRPRIDESIRMHDKLLLVLSESSLTSTWVKKEVETAFENEAQLQKLVLFPIRLDDTVMHTPQVWGADIRRMRHIGDFTRWKNHDDYQQAFTRLLRDLKAGA